MLSALKQTKSHMWRYFVTKTQNMNFDISTYNKGDTTSNLCKQLSNISVHITL